MCQVWEYILCGFVGMITDWIVAIFNIYVQCSTFYYACGFFFNERLSTCFMATLHAIGGGMLECVNKEGHQVGWCESTVGSLVCYLRISSF